ncbi:hypothetical protein ACR79T_21655 [Sphingobacterium spiritivorum]
MSKIRMPILLLLIFLLFQTSCSKELVTEESGIEKSIELSFSSGKLKEKLYYENGSWIAKSKNVVRKEYRDLETGKISYGYAFVFSTAVSNSSSNKTQVHSIEKGLYGWNGTCFIWGTLITGDNGESIFIAADIETQKLLNVCPGE